MSAFNYCHWVSTGCPREGCRILSFQTALILPNLLFSRYQDTLRFYMVSMVSFVLYGAIILACLLPQGFPGQCLLSVGDSLQHQPRSTLVLPTEGSGPRRRWRQSSPWGSPWSGLLWSPEEPDARAGRGSAAALQLWGSRRQRHTHRHDVQQVRMKDFAHSFTSQSLCGSHANASAAPKCSLAAFSWFPRNVTRSCVFLLIPLPRMTFCP